VNLPGHSLIILRLLLPLTRSACHSRQEKFGNCGIRWQNASKHLKLNKFKVL
jgi:hypothetical protein